MTVFFNKLLLDFKHLKNFYFLIINFFFNFISNIFVKTSSNNYDFFLENYSKYKFSLNLYNFIFKKNLIIDFIWLFFFSNNYKYNYSLNKLFRSNFRLLNTKNNFYFNLKNLNSNKNHLNFLKNFNLIGFYYIWSAIRIWILPVFLLISIIYMFLFLKALPFNKVLFAWICVIMFSYWLLSGFVFFF